MASPGGKPRTPGNRRQLLVDSLVRGISTGCISPSDAGGGGGGMTSPSSRIAVSMARDGLFATPSSARRGALGEGAGTPTGTPQVSFNFSNGGGGGGGLDAGVGTPSPRRPPPAPRGGPSGTSNLVQPALPLPPHGGEGVRQDYRSESARAAASILAEPRAAAALLTIPPSRLQQLSAGQLLELATRLKLQAEWARVGSAPRYSLAWGQSRSTLRSGRTNARSSLHLLHSILDETSVERIGQEADRRTNLLALHAAAVDKHTSSPTALSPPRSTRVKFTATPRTLPASTYDTEDVDLTAVVDRLRFARQPTTGSAHRAATATTSTTSSAGTVTGRDEGSGRFSPLAVAVGRPVSPTRTGAIHTSGGSTSEQAPPPSTRRVVGGAVAVTLGIPRSPLRGSGGGDLSVAEPEARHVALLPMHDYVLSVLRDEEGAPAPPVSSSSTDTHAHSPTARATTPRQEGAGYYSPYPGSLHATPAHSSSAVEPPMSPGFSVRAMLQSAKTAEPVASTPSRIVHAPVSSQLVRERALEAAAVDANALHSAASEELQLRISELQKQLADFRVKGEEALPPLPLPAHMSQRAAPPPPPLALPLTDATATSSTTGTGSTNGGVPR